MKVNKFLYFAIILLMFACIMTSCKCEHEIVIDAAIDATCVQTGLTEGAHCGLCNEVLVTPETIPAKGHSESKNESIEATCTETGLTEGTYCSVCEEILVAQEIVPENGHTEVNREGKEATCTDTGLTEGTDCSVCGEVLIAQEIIPAKGHTEVIKAGKEATCTATGLTEGKDCSVCGTVLKAQKSIAAKGHTEAVRAGKKATCTATGLTDEKYCKVCNVVTVKQQVISAKGHSWRAATCSAAKTCTTCGQTEGNVLNHQQGNDGKCIYCKKTLIDFSTLLSAPMDTLEEIKAFVDYYYYYKNCYKVGNYRFIFNSADGIILSWGAKNTSNKTIKYITCTIEYYNSVNDPAYDDITEKKTCTIKLTGPIDAGKRFYFRDLIGYGSGVTYGKMTDVTIEYMDGTTISGYYGYTTWHNSRIQDSPNKCYLIEK